MDTAKMTSNPPTNHNVEASLPNEVATPPQKASPLIHLSSTASKCFHQTKSHQPRLRKATSYSRVLSVAFALGEKCRHALLKGRSRSPRTVTFTQTISVPLQVSDPQENVGTNISDVLDEPERLSVIGGLEETSISPPRISYESSSFVTVTYTDSGPESVRSSFDSEVSFCCRGLGFHECEIDEDPWQSDERKSRLISVSDETFPSPASLPGQLI